MYALRTERIDPASLPAAGSRIRHDSLNEDYRYKMAHSPSVEGSSPPRRLQKSDDLRTVSSSFPKSKIELPAAAPRPHNKPDFHYIGDIDFAGPAPRPGLTLIQPLSEASSPCGTLTSSGNFSSHPAPSRQTNPLSPNYIWSDLGLAASSANSIKVYPMATQEPGEWRNTSPVRRGALDTSDIAGSSPSRVTRSRKDVYDNFDYGDVTHAPLSPVRHRVLRDGRSGTGPAAAPRLGIWSGSLGGDSGHFLATSRTPTNPNQPVYKIHGDTVANAKDVGQTKCFFPPTEPLRQSWRDTGDRSLVDSMKSFSDHRVFNRSSSLAGPAQRHGQRIKNSDYARAAAEVAALV